MTISLHWPERVSKKAAWLRGNDYSKQGRDRTMREDVCGTCDWWVVDGRWSAIQDRTGGGECYESPPFTARGDRPPCFCYEFCRKYIRIRQTHAEVIADA